MNLLGQGEFGSVYTDGIVAIKRFNNKNDAYRELCILRDLEHPNIISMIASDDISITVSLYVGSLLDGKDKISKLGLTTELLAGDMMDALIHMYSRGYNHCDVMRRNILYSDDRFVLCDLGEAKWNPLRLFQTNRVVIGSRDPIPELYLDIDSIDLWDLAICILEYETNRDIHEILYKDQEYLDALDNIEEDTNLEEHIRRLLDPIIYSMKSDDMIDWLKKILTIDNRISLREAYEHPFVGGLMPKLLDLSRPFKSSDEWRNDVKITFKDYDPKLLEVACNLAYNTLYDVYERNLHTVTSISGIPYDQLDDLTWKIALKYNMMKIPY